MAQETVRLFRTDDPSGAIQIEVDIAGSRRLLAVYPSQEAFVAMQHEWANRNPLAAGELALAAYLAVDPTAANPALMTDVVTEIDPSALTIVRRSAAL